MNEMNKKTMTRRNAFFDFGLYKEGLLQLKTMGLVFLVLFCLEGILIPVRRLIDVMTYGTLGDYARIQLMDTVELHPVVFLLFTLVVPLLALSLFSFLTKRSTSDAYHSIPHTRTCLFLSFAGAVLTWVLAIHWISLILSLILHSLTLGAGIMVLGKILLQNLAIDVVCLLVLSAILIAVSITGTLFGNVIATGTILFIPRALMLLYRLGIGNSLSVVTPNQMADFLGNGWNLLTGLLFGFFEDTMLTGWNLFVLWKPILYTLCLAILQMCLGAVLFRRRRSEVAGHTASSTKLQLFLRLIPAFLFSLIPNMLVFDMICDHAYVDLEDVYMLFVLYLVSVVLYFLFELLTTRKLRNLAKAIPGLALLAVLNVAMIFSMNLVRNNILKVCPDASQIQSVIVGAGEKYVVGPEGTGYLPGYFSSRAARIQLQDEELSELIAQRLADTIAYDKDEYHPLGEYSHMDVEIQTGNRRLKRSIIMYPADMNQVGTVFHQDPQLVDIYMNLPEADDPNLQLEVVDLEPEAARQIYAALREDVQDMGFEAWYSYCRNDYYGTTYEAQHPGRTYNQLTSLRIYYQQGVTTTGAMFPITSATPKAVLAYLEASARNSAEEKDAMEMMIQDYRSVADVLDSDNAYTACDLNLYQIQNGELIQAGYSSSGELTDEDWDFLEKLLREEFPVEDTRNCLWLNLSLGMDYPTPNGEWNGYWGWVVLPVPGDIQFPFGTPSWDNEFIQK